MWPWLSSLNALLFSKMSVLSPASTLSSPLCSFPSPAGSFQPSDLWSPLSVALSSASLPLLEPPSCPFSALSVVSRPFLSLPSLCLAGMSPPLAALPHLSALCVQDPSLAPGPFKGKPPYLGEWGCGKVKEDVGELDYGINEDLWDRNIENR